MKLVLLLLGCLAYVLLAGVTVVEGENVHDIICSQEFVGFRLDYQKRRCVKRKARGCVDPFPYKTRQACIMDFRGEGNLCASSPCKHGGMCLPITTHSKGRTFKCDCFATGYYGKRCHRRCPKKLSKRSKQTACITIG